MKNRIGAVILVGLCLGLGIALIVVKQHASDRQTHDAETIGNYSNEWVATSKKLDDKTQVAAEFEKELAAQKQAFVELTNTFSRVSADLVSVSATLSTTEASLKSAQEAVAKRDAKIADLEDQNHALDKQALDLGTAITNLTLQIADTKKQLATSEGDKAYLENQLRRLLAEKTELERQFNDVAAVRGQLRKLKAELTVARRLDWIRRGLLVNTEQKGAQKLLQGAAAPRPPTPAANYDLNVELNSQGGARIVPASTNNAANTNLPAK